MAERIDPAVRGAAERLLVDLAADEKFVAHVAKAEIDRRVAAGELVPIGRLQLGGGLELTPMGRVAALEGAVSSALALLDADLPNMADAVRAVLAPALPSGQPVVPPITGSPEPAEVLVEEEPVAARPPDDGRPPGMLAPGESTTCEWDMCTAVIDADQANLAFTRFRKMLCKKHYAKYPSRSAA